MLLQSIRRDLLRYGTAASADAFLPARTSDPWQRAAVRVNGGTVQKLDQGELA